MRRAIVKGVAMKPMLKRAVRVSVNAHKTEALQSTKGLQLQSWIVTLMAALIMIVCTTASSVANSADAHDTAAHGAGSHVSKREASEKVYPSRALQGVVTPLAPGATLHKMTLSHHELEAWSFVPKRKDRIEIENRSNITHALYVTYPDGTVVNLEIQIPGDVVSWTVPDDAEGEYVFRCWIHPVIRANMKIGE